MQIRLVPASGGEQGRNAPLGGYVMLAPRQGMT
jgi:hypothetical protein